MRMFKLLLSCLFLSLFFFSLINDANAIRESNTFQKQWDSSLLPFYLKQGIPGKFDAKDGLHISYRYFTNEGAHSAIVVVPGRTEPDTKYAELIDELYQAGYMVFILDHRGQGESDRMLKDPQIGYVNKFQDYVDDFRQFVNTIVVPIADRAGVHDLHLLAHSMGGAIAILYLEQNLSPFHSVVLSSPMFKPNYGSHSELEVWLNLNFNLLIGNGDKYVQGYGPTAPASTFSPNKLTHSVDRYLAFQKLLQQFPSLIVGGPSYHWLGEVVDLFSKLTAGVNRYTIPTLIFQAAKDEVVSADKEAELCEALNRSERICELHSFFEAGHEVLMEKDEIRTEALGRAFAWFSAHAR